MDIVVSISGYAGEPVSLLAFSDPGNGVLAIAKKTRDFQEAGLEGFAFVTNTRAETYDCLFTEEHMADAIRAFLVGEGSELITLGDHASRYRPRIETDGVNESGQKYRLPADLTNGEVAVLALTHFHSRQRAITTAGAAMDEFFDLVMI